MIYSLLVGVVTFGVALVAGRPLIALFHRWGVLKGVRVDGPESHLTKMGTPTMGGILIIGSVVMVTVVANLVGRLSMLLPLGVMVGVGLIGVTDDLRTLKGGFGVGLSPRLKMAGLLSVGLAVALVLHYFFQARSIYIPSLGKLDIGLWYLPVATLAVVGTANAVNLTDGLDTLAGGTVAVAFAAYGIIAFLQEQAYVVTFSFTVVGATLGFLWYNSHPAQLFMGDTGSLALGATLATVALMTGHWLLLPVVGTVFVAEALSDILQVGYFKLSGGNRILRMAPLHHHFELVGWSEPQVTMRFWLVGMMAAMVGVALALW
ncbi:MAG: phospho-N-acetylmuramoyl-pentapeptide-transferase [Chloroflexi bacterium]|nr:phospho-N-acetylmuramoyl-pentapeptide-transferase [Chloroflexota bacterium]